jgi:hypothetical protein
MLAPTTLKHMAAVTLSAFTFFFCSLAVGQEAIQKAPGEQPKSTTGAAQEVKATPTGDGNLTFLDDQQTWRESEINSYQEWLKRNPRYSHPIVESRLGSNVVDDKPDPNYRPWYYRQPWYNCGAVSNVRGRILWVNDRYPSYTQKAASGAKDTEKPKAETAAPAHGK